MRRNIFLLLITIALILGMAGCDNSQDEEIPDGYIAIFQGGGGELTHETYIYKLDNNNPNKGYRYIHASSWGMTAQTWQQKVTGKGTVLKKEDVFKAAESNKADSYVILPNDSKIYTIQEYKDIFLKN